MTDFPFPSLWKITISESQKWHHQHCETSRLGVFKNGTMYNLPVTKKHTFVPFVLQVSVFGLFFS